MPDGGATIERLISFRKKDVRTSSAPSCFSYSADMQTVKNFSPVHIEVLLFCRIFRTVQPRTPAGLELEVLERTKSHKWLGCVLSMINMGNRQQDMNHRLQKKTKSHICIEQQLTSNGFTLWSRRYLAE